MTLSRMRFSSVLATELGFLAVIGVLFVFNAMSFWPNAIDDAYIAFRFAENLAGGMGLRFNAGGALVEGFTSPAWVLLSAVAIALGLDAMLAAKIAGLVCGLGLILLSWRFAKTLRGRTDGWNLLPPLLIAMNAHVAFWAMQGMEMLLQSLVVLAAYHGTWRWMHEGKCAALSAAAIVLAVFVRIDSIVLMVPLGVMVLAMCGGRWWQHHSGRKMEGMQPPMKGLLRWMGIVCAGLMLIQAMRLLIFNEWLPNTYYAKVGFAPWNGERASAYLFEFFFNQGGWRDGSDVGSVGWWLSGGPVNSLAWMNLWLATVLLLVVECVRVTGRAMLLLGAVAVSTWYAWHIGGDWMPGFRFLVPTVVFLAIASALAIDQWKSMTAEWAVVQGTGIGLLMLACVGTISEQVRTETAYVFGREPIWVERGQRWLSLATVRERLQRGFEPALLETTSVLALETQAGARILMSDIGLPMWSSPHLHVIDADGLVDKHLADAPGVRGETFGGPALPTRRQIEWELREQLGDRPVTADVRRWLREESARIYREEVMARNVRLVMQEMRPEYILVFEVHPGEDTSVPGVRYPEIIERVTRHPEFERYVLMQSWSKLDGNVWNHLYRRDDVPPSIRMEERARRMEVLIARNPRVQVFQLMQAASQLVEDGGMEMFGDEELE